jgi:hypothetical protein
LLPPTSRGRNDIPEYRFSKINHCSGSLVSGKSLGASRDLFLSLLPAELVCRGCYRGEDKVNSGAEGKPGKHFPLIMRR